jgi:hypothetical protein
MRNNAPPTNPKVLSDIYRDARAPPVTARSVAKAWPTMAPTATPALKRALEHTGAEEATKIQQVCLCSASGWQPQSQKLLPRGECEAPKATVASMDRSPHSAKKIIVPTYKYTENLKMQTCQVKILKQER